MYNNLQCPNCKADLRGNPLPQFSYTQYNNTHISKAIGIAGGGDIIKWQCPICNYTWDNKDVADNSYKEEKVLPNDTNIKENEVNQESTKIEDIKKEVEENSNKEEA